MEITQAGVCRGYFRTWGSVAEGVVGKIYCPCREDPLSFAVGRMVLTGCGKRSPVSGEESNEDDLIYVVVICRVHSEFSF